MRKPADGTGTPLLSTVGHAALAGNGILPVGSVTGCSVFHIGHQPGWCGYAPLGPTGAGRPRASVMQQPAVRDSLVAGRRGALTQLRTNATALGADGVVQVRLGVRLLGSNIFEFSATGTAVRLAAQQARPVEPFTCGLTGPELATLLRAGYLPVAFVLGVGAVVRHDDRGTVRQRRSWSNKELTGYSTLLTTARDQARAQLGAAATASGATGVVAVDLQVRIDEEGCEVTARGRRGHGRDHLVSATMTGTSITPLPAGPTTTPLPILRLRRPTRP